MRLKGIGARLLAATAICIVCSAPALAEDFGITSSDTDPIVVAAGENVVGDKSGIISTGSQLNLTNDGTIRGNGTASFTSNTDGGVVFKGGPASIINSGDISGARFGISSFYYFTDFSDPDNPVIDFRAVGSTLDNSGSIIGDSDDGVRFIGGGTVTNSGYIAGRVGGGADGISIFSYQGQPLDSFVTIGSVTNLAGGVIEGNRFGIIMSNGGSVSNAGTISGNSGSILLQAVQSDPGRTGTVTNSGTLNGTVAFNDLASASVTNSGTITGATSGIRDSSASLTVDNSGTIRGNGLNSFTSNTDAGIAFNGGPADIINSGSISGARFGISSYYYFTDFTDPDNPVWDFRASGSTLNNSGSIIGDSDDGVRFIGGGAITNSGYIAGRVGASADGISMFSGEGQPLDSFVTIGSVDNLVGGVIEGNRFGIILSNGGSVSNAGTISGNSGAILLQSVEAGRTGTVTNSGTMNGRVAFNDLASASLTNSGTITGATSGVLDASGALTVNNSGTIRGNGLNGFTGNTDAGIAFKGGAANIINSGTITGARFGVSSFYYFSDPDNNLWDGRAINSTLTNSGTIIGDSDDGVRFIGGGTVTNSGIIRGLAGAGADGVSMFAYNGQNTSGMTSIGTVNNLAGATIQGNRFAIILSGGGTINNAGTLNGGTNGATLIQGAGGVGTVTNSGTINGSVNFNDLTSTSLTNGGTISAATTAISTNGNINVTNLAGGTIRGLSANGAYAAGIVQNNSVTSTLTLNNAGTISGQSDGLSFGIAVIQNSGIITGTALTGLVGVNAQITNSGTISGGQSGMILNGPSTITNTGQITGGQYGVYLAGGGTLTNSGTISRTQGCCAAVSFTHGGTLNNSGIIGPNKGSTADAVLLSTTAGNTVALVNDGKINGRVVISGPGSANVTINGRIDLGTSSLSVGDQSVPKAILSSSPTTLTINGYIFNPIQLSDAADTVIIGQKSTTTWIDLKGGQDIVQLTGTTNAAKSAKWVPWLDGTESVQVTGGYWTVNFTKAATYGTTTIGNGSLQVDASYQQYALISPITINSGGTLAGREGTILGNVTVNNGGSINPGGSYNGWLVPISTLSVTGNVAFNAGSTFVVDTTPTANNSDRLNVTGAVTINNGAALQVLAGNGKYTTSSYTVLAASSGINGQFGTVATDMAFLTPQLAKANNNTSLVLTLTYNKKPLTIAATAGTFGVASTISSLEQGNAIYDAVLFQSLKGASQAFESLSGGGYGRLDAALAEAFGKAQLKLDGVESDAPLLHWSDGNSVAAAGLKSGFASSRGPVSFGAIAGHLIEPIHAGELSGNADTYFFGGMVGYRADRFQGLASAATASHDVAVSRTISFPGFADGAGSRYRAATGRVDLEGSYSLADGSFTLAPYGGYSHVMLKSKAFNEQGGTSALRFGAESRAVDQVRLGVRLGHKLAIGGVTISPHLDASVQRAWGDLESKRDARFGFGSQEFDSIGSSFNSRSSIFDAGVQLNAGALTVAASYHGQIGDQWNDQSARVSAALRF